VIYRARLVVPVKFGPIENAEIHVANGTIISVQKHDLKKTPSDSVIDLGDTVVLPGFVNAHCHLDLTSFRNIVNERCFTDWLKKLVLLKRTANKTSCYQGWMDGVHLSLSTGVTSIANIETLLDNLTNRIQSSPARIFSFIEFLGVSYDAAISSFTKAIDTIKSLEALGLYAAISPHSLYSINSQLLEYIGPNLRAAGYRISMHVAESKDEIEMICHRSGALYEWLKTEFGSQINYEFHRAVEILESIGVLSDKFLAVHCNIVTDKEIDILATNSCHVVHCPRSHSYFKHPPFMFSKFLKSKVNICLGTDSAASVALESDQKNPLDLLQDIEILLKNNSGLSPEVVLQMATVNGAKALGLSGLVGSIEPGAYADFSVFNYSGPLTNAIQDVLSTPIYPSLTFIGGKPVYRCSNL